jgi:hypothetical protein
MNTRRDGDDSFPKIGKIMLPGKYYGKKKIIPNSNDLRVIQRIVL